VHLHYFLLPNGTNHVLNRSSHVLEDSLHQGAHFTLACVIHLLIRAIMDHGLLILTISILLCWGTKRVSRRHGKLFSTLLEENMVFKWFVYELNIPGVGLVLEDIVLISLQEIMND
jgi:hypothetical protein